MLHALGSAGWSAEEGEDVWEHRPPGKLPGPASQRALLEWLQAELGAGDGDAVRLSYLCLRREPRLMLRAAALPELRASRDTFAELCDMDDDMEDKLVRALARFPALLLTSGANLRASAEWLREVSELNSAQLARVLGEAPNLLLCQRAGIQARLDWLRAELGIERGGRLSRVVCKAPLCLTLSIEKTMAPKVGFLRGLGVQEDELGKIVVSSPRLLQTPVAELDRKVQWLHMRRVAAPAPSRQVAALLRLHPDFFSLTPTRCQQIFDWLRNQGAAAPRVPSRRSVSQPLVRPPAKTSS